MSSDDHIQATVTQILAKHGVRDFRFAGRPEGAPCGAGLSAVSPSGVLLFQVKHARPTSIEEVLGILAVGVLESRRGSGNNGLVLLLALERLGDKTRQAVRQFMSAHAPDRGWGLIDRSGAAQLVIPALNVDVDQPGRIAPPAWPRRRPVRLFSDLNQWMLKILLLADAPPSLWGGPRQRVATPTELHRVAKVSVEKAHQFFRAFEQIGLIRQTRDGLAVVRKRAIVEMWFHEQRSHSSLRMPVRSIFGEPGGLEQVLCKQNAMGDFAVCGFEACRSLGVLHTPVTNREVYVFGDPEEALAAWDLEACDDRDAHFHLRAAKPSQSILRGRLVHANLPVVDVLQAALDVCDQAARGTEQSEHIVDHVLGWRDGK